MAEKYKLTYFNLRGRAEGIRFMFHYAGVPFEDARIEREGEEWKTIKPTLPSQQLPTLEITQADGKVHVLSQTMAIARYLARQFNLNGDNSLESAQMDEIVATILDAGDVAAMAYYEPDPERKAKLYEKLKVEVLPAKMGFVERKLAANGGKFLVGNRYSWADFYVAAMIQAFQDYAGPVASGSGSVLPHLAALAKAVFSLPQITAYIATRPATSR